MTLFTRLRRINMENFLTQMNLCATRSLIWKQSCFASFGKHMPNVPKRSAIKLLRGKQKALNDILLEIPMLSVSLSDTSNYKTINWKDVHKCIEGMGSSEYNDVLIMDLCYRYNNYDAALSYVKYLMSQGKEINIGLAGKYLHCYYDRNKPLTLEEEEEICSVINDIKQKHEFLDDITLKHVIVALSLTRKWEEAFEMLNSLDMSAKNVTMCQAIAIAAFNNGKASIGFEMVAIIATKQPMKPLTRMYESHLNYCKKYRQKNIIDAIEEMFITWELQNYVPLYAELDVYIPVFTKLKWRAHRTSINRERCRNCSQQMNLLQMSKEEFKELKEVVLDKLVIGGDLYASTNPQELKNFGTFLEREQSYDMVIDGLNLMYIGRDSKEVYNLIDMFLSQEIKILLIIRRHAHRFYKNYDDNPQVLFYEVSDVTKDDIYVLYAAMMGGFHTTFLSGDLMRQHKFKLNTTALSRRYKQWQLSHHYRIASSTKCSLINRLMAPIKYRLAPAKLNGIWHIPITDEEHRSDMFFAEWLCLLPPHKQHFMVDSASTYLVGTGLNTV